ncbi:MAG: hypothetical protein OXE84_03340 [Rhodobacteraceae bacterium]|nr:hypothetical protein [Paracoccaceae bacterium]MCY4197041.1 hypothetical protein [Paracoccaceae bacterium]MCY4326355.1 hypothetical protein [Paracoccaceae bacterium]
MLPTLRVILAADVATDEIEEKVSYVFHEAGLMTGEFGAAQTDQAKADSIRPWLEDESTRVAAFAKKEIRSLENMAASERRRAKEEIALRKLNDGEPLSNDDE